MFISCQSEFSCTSFQKESNIKWNGTPDDEPHVDISGLERAFDTGNFELQKQALSSVGYTGKAGLPLLKRAFNTGNFELQKQALYSAIYIGRKKAVVLFLKKMLKNPDLDEDIKREIRWLL